MPYTLLNPNTTAEGLSAENMLQITADMGSNIALIRNSPKLVKLHRDADITTIYREAGDDAWDNPLAQDEWFFVTTRSQRPEGGALADYIHLTNEIGLPDAIDEWTRTCAGVAEDLGKRVVALNVETNHDLASWKRCQHLIEWLEKRGHKTGIHIYLDGNPDHDAGALAPLDWLLSIGIQPFVTEFAPIKSIFNSRLGFRSIPNFDYPKWLDENLPKLRGCPAFLFSVEDWPLASAEDPQAPDKGFGYGKFPSVIQAVASLNTETPTVTYDLMDYICPPNGKPYVLVGMGYENCQSLLAPDGWIEFRKNRHMEEFRVDANYIYRGADTSEISRDGVTPNGRFYIQYTTGDFRQYGAPWAKRQMAVGESFVRFCHVIWLDSTGKLITEYDETSTLILEKAATSVEGIPTLTFRWGGDERYTYGKGYGLIGWQNLKTGAGSHMDLAATPNIQKPFVHPVVRPRTSPPGEIMPTMPDRLKLGDPVEGTVTALKANFANIRELPSAKSKDIGDLLLNEPITFRPTLTPVIENFRWYALEKPVLGWVADVATLTPGVPEKWLDELDVPYVSQRDSNSSLYNNDCLIACLLMAIRYLRHGESGRLPTLPTVDDVARHSRLASGSRFLNFTDADILSTALGYQATYRRPLMTSDIVSLIDRNHPVIVLVDYARYNPGNGSFPHFALVKGYSQNYFLTHDPYLAGANLKISREALDAAMKTVPENTLSYQGLTIA